RLRGLSDYDTISPETNDDVRSPVTKASRPIMLPRFIILPAAASLLAAALAGCTERTAEPPQTIASTAQPPGDTGPRASERDAVLRGGLAGAGVGDRVFFAYDSSTLGPDALRVLQAQAA